MCTRASVRRAATTSEASLRCIPGWSGSPRYLGTCHRPVKTTRAPPLVESTPLDGSRRGSTSRPSREAGEGARDDALRDAGGGGATVGLALVQAQATFCVTVCVTERCSY